MTSIENPLLARVTVDPDVRFGKPCIGGHRIAVEEVLQWLAGGATQEQILADYPQLEVEDFLAIYAFAADLAAVDRRTSTGRNFCSMRDFHRSS